MLDRFLVAAADFSGQSLQAFFDGIHIRKHQFGFDGFCVFHGVDAAFDVGDVAAFETSHDMGDGVTFADIGQELVAQTLAFGGAFDETGDIDEGHAGRDDLF